MIKIEIFGIPYLKKGSGIHIKKKNRGKFTEYCGGEVTNECIQRAKKSKNPKLRKRATFAANARAWKHQDGGEMLLKAKQNAMGAVGKPNQFLDDWNQARLNTGRFDYQLGNGLMEQQKLNRDNTPIYYNSGAYANATFLRGNPIIYTKQETLQDGINRYKQQLGSYVSSTRKRLASPTDGTYVQNGAIQGEYNPVARTIYVNKDATDQHSTETHEQAHASKAIPQEQKVAEIIQGSSYLNDPVEVYARLMQLREANNIDPNQVWDKKQLKEFKKNAIDYNILNRYSDEQILRLFNEVADIGGNTAGSAELMLAKKGNKIHKPFGHRSILDNGWQSTKQLKNLKNVYGL